MHKTCKMICLAFLMTVMAYGMHVPEPSWAASGDKDYACPSSLDEFQRGGDLRFHRSMEGKYKRYKDEAYGNFIYIFDAFERKGPVEDYAELRAALIRKYPRYATGQELKCLDGLVKDRQAAWKAGQRPYACSPTLAGFIADETKFHEHMESSYGNYKVATVLEKGRDNSLSTNFVDLFEILKHADRIATGYPKWRADLLAGHPFFADSREIQCIDTLVAGREAEKIAREKKEAQEREERKFASATPEEKEKITQTRITEQKVCLANICIGDDLLDKKLPVEWARTNQIGDLPCPQKVGSKYKMVTRREANPNLKKELYADKEFMTRMLSLYVANEKVIKELALYHFSETVGFDDKVRDLLRQTQAICTDSTYEGVLRSAGGPKTTIYASPRYDRKAKRTILAVTRMVREFKGVPKEQFPGIVSGLRKDYPTMIETCDTIAQYKETYTAFICSETQVLKLRNPLYLSGYETESPACARHKSKKASNR